jgi:hypothetical protein
VHPSLAYNCFLLSLQTITNQLGPRRPPTQRAGKGGIRKKIGLRAADRRHLAFRGGLRAFVDTSQNMVSEAAWRAAQEAKKKAAQEAAKIQ